jgi:hypothetical protein
MQARHHVERCIILYIMIMLLAGRRDLEIKSNHLLLAEAQSDRSLGKRGIVLENRLEKRRNGFPGVSRHIPRDLEPVRTTHIGLRLHIQHERTSVNSIALCFRDVLPSIRMEPLEFFFYMYSFGRSAL